MFKDKKSSRQFGLVLLYFRVVELLEKRGLIGLNINPQ